MAVLYLNDLLSDTSGVESKCKICSHFLTLKHLPYVFFFSHTSLLFKVPSRFSHVSLEHWNILYHSRERQMAETHDPCPRNAHPREAGKGKAIRCHSYWALGDALPGLSHLVLAPLLSVLHRPRLPAGIFIVLSCACRNCSAVLFLFVSNFFQCLFLLLAFLSFSIPLLSQFDTTKIKPNMTFDMKDKSKHTILPCNAGHMKCLGIKKSSSRSTRVNYFFRET